VTPDGQRNTIAAINGRHKFQQIVLLALLAESAVITFLNYKTSVVYTSLDLL
jgi:hypothetical protein